MFNPCSLKRYRKTKGYINYAILNSMFQLLKLMYLMLKTYFIDCVSPQRGLPLVNRDKMHRTRRLYQFSILKNKKTRYYYRGLWTGPPMNIGINCIERGNFASGSIPANKKPDISIGFGGQGRNRTGDTRLFRPLLYQLSYLS